MRENESGVFYFWNGGVYDEYFQTELLKIAAGCEYFHNPRCTGKACIGRLTDDVTVKLFFRTTGIADQYDALQLKLINRHEGEIDALMIRLNDVWGKVRMRSTGDMIGPHIWDDYGRVQWYGFTPTEAQYDALSDEVNEYLSAFVEPEQTESEEMDYTM